MATLNFIRGTIKGKLGKTVGSSWRGKDYVKTYVPPSNPNTEGQVVVRTIFQHPTHIAKAIYEPVLKPYTFPKPRKMTAFNRMIQINKPLFSELAWDQTKLKIFEGPLFNPSITTAAIQNAGTPAATVRVTFDAALGDGTDIAIAIIHDEQTETTVCGQATRADAQIDVLIATLDQADLTKLHAYLVFSKPRAQNRQAWGGFRHRIPGCSRAIAPWLKEHRHCRLLPHTGKERYAPCNGRNPKH
jgi:hypothetical protein